MKKWIALVLAVVVLLTGYVAAGPYLAIRGIHQSLEKRQLDKLERYVDFPVLRNNVQAQVEDRLAGTAASSGLVGGVTRRVVGEISDHAVDAMVSPAGIAILLEGRALARRIGNAPRATGDGEGNGYQPLADAATHYDSASRFTATTTSADGQTVVFVFQRTGLTWKLSDIRLP